MPGALRSLHRLEGETIGRISSRHLEQLKTYADGFISYIFLRSLGFNHKVNHSKGDYARGKVHIDGCESRASLLRPWLAVHRGISKDSLGVYLSLFHFQRATGRLSSPQRLKLIKLKSPTNKLP